MQINLIIGLIQLAIIIMVVWFLIKKAFHLAFIVIIIFGFYQLFFVMSGDDLNSAINLDKYLSPSLSEKIITFFNDLDSSREENALIDEEAIYEEMTKTLENSTIILKEELSSVDYEKLSRALAERIQEEGQNISETQISEELSKAINDIDSDDIKTISNSIQETLKSMSEND